MNIIKSLSKRRSYYDINNKLEVSKKLIIEKIEEITELIPDAFNSKTTRVAIAFDKTHELIWDEIYNSFNGKVSRTKIDSFKSGAGTILFYYDKNIITEMQEKFPSYAENFPAWANQTNGALQISIWSMLRELNIGASLQHYNPIIDKNIQKILNLPDNYVLVAQMPFGGIVNEAIQKDNEKIKNRVKIFY